MSNETWTLSDSAETERRAAEELAAQEVPATAVGLCPCCADLVAREAVTAPKPTQPQAN